jgi:hypothetical protein
MAISAPISRQIAAPTALVRRANLAVVVVAGAGLLLQLLLVIFHPDPAPDNPDAFTRVVRFFSYFTIQSNLAVLFAALAVLRGRDVTTGRQRILRLAALTGITVTGVVYATVLAGAFSHTGAAWYANALLHYVCPPVAVLVWLVAGPFAALRPTDLPRMLLWPLLWVAFTLVRGATTDWYPYPFIDVFLQGYDGVAVNLAAVIAFAVGLGVAFIALDRWRGRVAHEEAKA